MFTCCLADVARPLPVKLDTPEWVDLVSAAAALVFVVLAVVLFLRWKAKRRGAP